MTDDVATVKALFRSGDIAYLRDEEGWSWSEIADHLGVKPALLHAVRTGCYGSIYDPEVEDDGEEE